MTPNSAGVIHVQTQTAMPLAFTQPQCQTLQHVQWYLLLNNYRAAPFSSFLTSYQSMSLFPNSSNIVINGGIFTSIGLPTQEAGRFKFPFRPYY